MSINTVITPEENAEIGSGVATTDFSSVHTQSTSEPFGTKHSYRLRMIRRWLPQLATARNVYLSQERSFGGTAAKRLAQCRTSAFFVQSSKTKKLRVASNRCNLRWCPMCSNTKKHILQENVGAWVKELRVPKFLTLTLRHTQAPLELQIDHLYDSFKKFRKDKLWKKHVKGGIWFFQITKSKTDGTWHPHLHCLLDAEYIPHRFLKTLWRKSSVGSDIVDIRAVKNPQIASDYVARYATAPADLTGLPQHDALTVVQSLRSRRICGTWGTARKVSLTFKAPDPDEKWRVISGFETAYLFGKKSELYALIVECYEKDEPYLGPSMLDTVECAMEPRSIEFEPETHKQSFIKWTGCIKLGVNQ